MPIIYNERTLQQLDQTTTQAAAQNFMPLPKIHKGNAPLRPSVPCVTTFAYDLSRLPNKQIYK